jgi:uncharacterized RDD family membrane protein YckC
VSSTPPQKLPPHGYLSEQDKRSFTLFAGILGALFFFIQILLPFAMMFLVMQRMSFDDVHLSRGVSWKGGFWFVEEDASPFRGTTEKAVRLRRVEPGAPDEFQELASVGIEDIWLLPDEDRLWLISSESLGHYENGVVEMSTLAQQLGSISRPFFYEGVPALVESHPEGHVLRTYTNGEWRKAGELELKSDSDCACDLQVVACGGTLHSFLRYRGALYQLERLPFKDREERNWQTVGNVSWRWTSACVGQSPVVFNHDGENNRIVGFMPSGDTWTSFFTYTGTLMMDLGVHTSENDENFALLLDAPSGSIAIVEVEDGQVVRETGNGGLQFSVDSMPYLVFLPHVGTLLLPFILAIVLSVQMRKHRVCEYRAGAGSVAFAPLWSRALAQLVDAAFVAAPMGGLVFYWFTYLAKESVSQEQPFFVMFALMGAVAVWLVLIFVLFSYTEGRWGRTPGKWLLGIKVVGSELELCGFGRGLIRNALKFVDGFFNYMVGILIVALTENWQRVGDLAARTLVVRAKSHEALVRESSSQNV